MGLAIIYLYDSTATDFTYNGQPLNKAYEAVVDNMINDSFFVTFNHPLDDKGIYKNIEKDKIVKVHTPDGMQPFRIMDRVKYMDHVSIEAWPLFYADMRNKLVKPLTIRGLSGQAAMNMFVNNLLIDTPFTFASNISDMHDYHTQDTEERENNPNQLYNALDVFKDIVKRWQGELVINGYDIRVVNRLGNNTGALLYEKKNISDFTDEESIQDITTRLYGKSEWTERPQGSDEEVKHEISVKVESPLINAYSGIVFEKQYTNNNIRTEKEMKDWLNLKFTTENIDKPSRNIKVGTNIVDNTVINLGDSLVLKYVNHDVDMEIRMIGYTYDGYANRYITIQLGDAKESYVGNVQNTVRDLETNVGSVVKQTVNQILNANGERMIYSVNEPVGNFKNGDVWFDQQGGMYFWDEARGMWIDHPYNRNMNLIADKIVNEIEPEISKMTASIAEADQKGQQALEKVGVNTNLLDEHQNIIAGLNGQLSDDLVTDQTVINPKTWLTNYGELVANNSYDTTDYFPVSEGDLLSLESTVSHYYKLAFYDNDKNNLGYYDGSKVVLTPSGTAYFGNTGTFNAPADGYVRLSYSTTTGGADTVKLSNQNNLYTLINSGYNNALSALKNVNRAMQEFGENLISYDGLNRGYWLNAQGKLMENAPYKTTDYIRVDSGERYKLTGGNAVYQVYFYDANRDAIAYYDGKGIKTDVGTGLKYFTTAPNIELIMPANASYVRIASSIADFGQVSFSKLSTVIANMFNAVDDMEKRVENDLITVRNTANEAFDKANVNDGKLTTVEQTVDDLKGEISQKVTSADVSTALNTFNETVKTQTASQITSSLTGYAKSTDLNDFATETYATNKAVEEAGKVQRELTSYAKSDDLTTLAENIRTETAESLKSVYTKAETNGLLGDKVSQATYESGIDGVNRSILALEKESETHTNRINSVTENVDGNSLLIANIKNSPESNIIGYQEMKERSDLYSRTIGSTDEEINSKIARMVMTDSVFQTEIATAKSSGLNLIDRATESQGYMSGVTGNGVLTGDLAERSRYVRIKNIQGGQTYTLAKQSDMASDANQFRLSWRGSDGYTVVSSLSVQGDISTVTAPTNAKELVISYPRDSEVKMEIGSTFTGFALTPDLASKITQTANSWAVQLKDGNDLKAEINASTDGLRFAGHLIYLDGDTHMHNAFAEKIKAIEISADKITTGTLDGSRIRANSIDTNRLTGNISEFIRTNWNAAVGGGVDISGLGVRSIDKSGSRVTMENGVISVGNHAGVNLGFFGGHLLNPDATGTMTMTASLGTEMAFLSATSADGRTYQRAMSIMAGASEIDMFTTLDMGQNSIRNVSNVGFNGGEIRARRVGNAGYMTYDTITGHAFAVAGTDRMSITSVVHIWSGIDMHGKDLASVGKLTYNSDERLKTNIKDADIRALDAISKWQLVSYDWRESGEHVEIGLIAQSTPELMTYSKENDTYGIDAGKQTMLNTLAIQQLNTKVDSKVVQLEKKIASLQDELALLKGA